MRTTDCRPCAFASAVGLGRAAARPAAGGLVEDDLANAHGGRRDLDALVLAAELERLLEAELARRHEPDELVTRRGAHVGELLLLGDVDVHVVVTGVLTD